MQKKQTTVIKFNGSKKPTVKTIPKSAGNDSLRKHNDKLEYCIKEKKSKRMY